MSRWRPGVPHSRQTVPFTYNPIEHGFSAISVLLRGVSLTQLDSENLNWGIASKDLPVACLSGIFFIVNLCRKISPPMGRTSPRQSLAYMREPFEHRSKSVFLCALCFSSFYQIPTLSSCLASLIMGYKAKAKINS